MIQSFDELFTATPIMLILRNLPFEQTLKICEQAWGLGVRAVEIPLQSDAAYETLRRVAERARARNRVVGAGTVLTPTAVDSAIEAGAEFIVSPGFDEEVWEACSARGIPHLPGVATGSDITRAVRSGAIWLKAFPARELGSGWIAAMHGPFPDVKFVATGGMSNVNADEFIKAGAAAVSLGTAAADPREIERILTSLSTAR